MKPITREEYYLAKIAGTWQGKTPEPVTIEEYYLATMAGDYSGNTPQPVTRLQYYMAKAAGVWGGSIPAPVTRLEYYWAAIAGKEGHIPDPVTRQEYLLYAISQSNNDVINTVFGATIIINDAAEGRPFRGLRVFGKSTQDGTPSVENPVPIVNAGEGGSITVEVTGRNLLKPNSHNTYYEFPLKSNTVITLMTNGKPSQGGNIKFSATDGSNVWFSIDAGQTRVCRSIGNKDVKGFYNLLTKGDGLEYMFAVGDIKTYTPYVEPQSLTLQTPNGLPGVPVSKDGNYTDADGQQWVCDERDYGRGKYVQRVLKTKPNKTIVFQKKHESGICESFNRDFNVLWARGDIPSLSTIAVWSKWTSSEGTFALHLDGLYYKDSSKTLEEVNAIFAKLGTNIEFCGVLDTPIERDLTPEELAAYKALHTNYPTTVITNDAGAHMEVSYVADTKAYINKKFEELNQAIVKTQIALL